MNYREEVLRTANANVEGVTKRFNENPFLLNAATGLAAEGGEFADIIKKYIYHGAPLDRDKLLKELSDIRWYFEQACFLLNTTIEEIEEINIKKLKARYPQGFSTQASIERRDVSSG